MKHYKYKFILLYVIYLFNSYLYAQAAYHIELLAQFKFQNIDSIWGYTDSNSHEYALLGTSEGSESILYWIQQSLLHKIYPLHGFDLREN